VREVGCVASPEREIVNVRFAQPTSFTEDCHEQERARLEAWLRAQSLPNLPECATVEQAFAFCIAAIEHGSADEFARCLGVAAPPVLAHGEAEQLAQLGVGMPLVGERFGLVSALGDA